MIILEVTVIFLKYILVCFICIFSFLGKVVANETLEHGGSFCNLLINKCIR